MINDFQGLASRVDGKIDSDGGRCRLKSRAELDGEPRRMQFVIESLCPLTFEETPETYAAMLPIVVWVNLDIRPRIHPEEKCHAPAYVVTFADAAEIRKKFGLTSNCDYRVCEHMGHLIE